MPFDSWLCSSACLNSGFSAALGAAGTELWSLLPHWGWAELSHVLLSGECTGSCSEGLVLSGTEVQQLQCWAVPVAAGAARGSERGCGRGGGQVRTAGLGLAVGSAL